MSQDFTPEIDLTQKIKETIKQVVEPNFDALKTNFSGTDRPTEDLEAGQFFYHEDDETLEYYDGTNWIMILTTSSGGNDPNFLDNFALSDLPFTFDSTPSSDLVLEIPEDFQAVSVLSPTLASDNIHSYKIKLYLVYENDPDEITDYSSRDIILGMALGTTAGDNSVQEIQYDVKYFRRDVNENVSNINPARNTTFNFIPLLLLENDLDEEDGEFGIYFLTATIDLDFTFYPDGSFTGFGKSYGNIKNENAKSFFHELSFGGTIAGGTSLAGAGTLRKFIFGTRNLTNADGDTGDPKIQGSLYYNNEANRFSP